MQLVRVGQAERKGFLYTLIFVALGCVMVWHVVICMSINHYH